MKKGMGNEAGLETDRERKSERRTDIGLESDAKSEPGSKADSGSESEPELGTKTNTEFERGTQALERGHTGRAERAEHTIIEESDNNIEVQSCCTHHKTTPRSDEELKLLKNRLNRMTGQLNGIGKMLDDNRYCGDVLNQVAAVESALQSFAYAVLQDHMNTCVVEEIQKGNLKVVQETVDLVKKLK